MGLGPFTGGTFAVPLSGGGGGGAGGELPDPRPFGDSFAPVLLDATPGGVSRTTGPLRWMVYGGVEIASEARTFAYLANRYDATTNPLGLDVPAELLADGLDGICAALYFDEDDVPILFQRPDGAAGANGDPAPWYDPSAPMSGEFLGVLIRRISGLDSTAGRRVTDRGSGLGGGVLGVQRQATREMTVEATLIATSCPGLDYGKRWLAHTLSNDFCDTCATYPLELRTSCPPVEDPDYGLVNLYEVGLTAGPKRQTDQPAECCSLLNVEWTLTAGDPWFYTCPVVELARTELTEEVTEVSVRLDPPTTFGVVGAVVEIETGASGPATFTIQAWTGGAGDDCPGAGDPCVEMVVAAVPTNSVLTIDGARQEMTFTATDGTVTDAVPYVTIADGQLFTWPEFPGCEQACVEVGTDLVAAGMAVTISSRQRLVE